MSAKGWLVTAIAFLALCVAAAFSGDDEPVPTASATPAAVTTQQAPIATAAAAPKPVGLRVARVIDGDTFVLPDGTEVRVLGIDSCEMSTPQGQAAKESAELWLSDSDLALTQEPGVDRDRYGRQLRYVHASGLDFAKTMVGYDHTGVYRGRNDASPEYVAALRELDTSGRTCSGAPPVNDNAYVPTPSGDDNDGESRFCRKRKWC